MRSSTGGGLWWILRVGLPLAAGACAAMVVLGFLGNVHPLFDTIGQFRAHAAVLLGFGAVALGLTRRFAASLASLAVAALGIYSVLPFMVPAHAAHAALSGAPRYTILQMNLHIEPVSHAPALSLIARLRPDVVTAQEMTVDWKADFERLRSAYPYQFYCTEPFAHGNTAILSRRPFVEGDTGESICRDNEKFSARTIDFNGMPVTIAAQHLRWPWPGRQLRMLDALVPVLGSLHDPLIVAGDFNSAPWTETVRRYAEASRTRVVGGLGPSWLTKFLPTGLARYVGLPIDNLLVSDGIEVLDARTLAPTASDHLPVLLTFTMRFALPEEPDVKSAAR